MLVVILAVFALGYMISLYAMLVIAARADRNLERLQELELLKREEDSSGKKEKAIYAEA